jgi:hypothetical protein
MNLHFGLVFEKMVQQFNAMGMYDAATLEQITCRVVNGRRATATPRKTKVSTNVQRDRRTQLLTNGYVSGILYPQLVCNIVGDLGLHSLRQTATSLLPFPFPLDKEPGQCLGQTQKNG